MNKHGRRTKEATTECRHNCLEGMRENMEESRVCVTQYVQRRLFVLIFFNIRDCHKQRDVHRTMDDQIADAPNVATSEFPLHIHIRSIYSGSAMRF